jgi:hypothetical protein
MSEGVELDRTARELIAAGREVPRPDDLATERIRRAVERRLRGPAPTARSKLRATTTILVALGALGLGGILYATELVGSPDIEPTPSKLEPKALSPQPRQAMAAPSVAAPVPPAIGSAAPGRPRASSNSRGEALPSLPRSQQLAAEIELLARVNVAVNAGDGKRALDLLGEYDRRFGAGILAEERVAASVLALCAAGRAREARAAAERFQRRWPRSPLLGRIEASCAGSR